jgi:hypothetical protein
MQMPRRLPAHSGQAMVSASAVHITTCCNGCCQWAQRCRAQAPSLWRQPGCLTHSLLLTIKRPVCLPWWAVCYSMAACCRCRVTTGTYLPAKHSSSGFKRDKGHCAWPWGYRTGQRCAARLLSTRQGAGDRTPAMPDKARLHAQDVTAAGVDSRHVATAGACKGR